MEEEETKDCNYYSGCNIDHESVEPHTCPYKTEIDEDYETLCQCCPEGISFCSQEI